MQCSNEHLKEEGNKACECLKDRMFRKKGHWGNKLGTPERKANRLVWPEWNDQ